MTESITVHGLDEFRQKVSAMKAATPKKLKVVDAAAAEIIVTYARRTMPRRTGRGIGSVKSRTTAKGAVVTEGGAKAPWVPWLDFGGRGRRPGRPAARPFLKEGRYTYKGLRVRQDEITAAANAGLVALATDAGLEVT